MASGNVAVPVLTEPPRRWYVAEMVTARIYKSRRRLFLKEHREAKGLSAEQMAGRMEMTRESIYRCEREPRRLNSEDLANWAYACGVEPEELWRPPGYPSLDRLVDNASDEVKEMAADIVRRLVNR